MSSQLSISWEMRDADVRDTARSAGFVGLGLIGKPMALRLAAAGLDLTVFDIAPGAADELVAAGTKAARSVAELAGQVDLLCVMVRDDDQVRDVVAEVLDAGCARLTVAIHSTVAPGTPPALARTAARHGVTVIDAPVSGGTAAAADGSLAIMVGADPETFDSCRGVFDVMGTKVVHAGPVGAGTRFKLARNLITFTSFAAATEAQRLAEAAGLDLVALGDVVRHTDALSGGPGSIMHRDTARPIPEADPWRGIFEHVAALGEKDLEFAADLAKELAVDVPLAELARERLAAGLGLPGGA